MISHEIFNLRHRLDVIFDNNRTVKVFLEFGSLHLFEVEIVEDLDNFRAHANPLEWHFLADKIFDSLWVTLVENKTRHDVASICLLIEPDIFVRGVHRINPKCGCDEASEQEVSHNKSQYSIKGTQILDEVHT